MVAPDVLVDASVDLTATKDNSNSGQTTPNGNETTNGTTTVQVINEEGYKQPSYVNLACCISGYTTLSYDPKRQALRSRNASPIRPSGLNQNVSFTADCGNYLAATPRNLTKDMQTQDKGMEILNGCGGLHSPRHVSNVANSLSKENRSYFNQSSLMTSERLVSYGSTTNEYYSRTTTTTTNYSSSNGNESRLIAPTKLSSVEVNKTSPSSFIVQRVERLYGPGALAQGFFTRDRNLDSNTNSPASLPCKTSNLDKDTTNDDSPLPVLKLLRPEFRAQLTVASRKSTENSNHSMSSCDSKQPSSLPSKINSSSTPSSNIFSSVKPISDVPDGTVVAAKKPVVKAVELKEKDVKDGHYYLKLLDEKVANLEKIANEAEEELLSCSSDEGCGILRAISGKARLLIAEKLNQFRGLCHKNIKQSSGDAFPTTNEDLAGFWDMVMIQVRDVQTQHEQLPGLKQNNWQVAEEVVAKPKSSNSTTTHKPTIRKTTSTTSNKPPSRRSASNMRATIDEARRKIIEEKRKALKEAANPQDPNEIETVIYCPEK